MSCKYSDNGTDNPASCEMQGTLREYDKNYIGNVLFTVKRGLCETDKYEDCEVYKLKESLAGKK